MPASAASWPRYLLLAHDAPDRRALRLSALTWGLIVCVLAIDAVWISKHGLSVAWREAAHVIAAFAACAAVALYYQQRRPDPVVLFQLQATMQLLIGSAALALCSYLLATLNLPLVDASLIAADHFFGFDWREHMAWLELHPWICAVLTVAYASAIPQVIMVSIALCLLRQFVIAQRFLFAFMLSAFVCVIASGLWPSVGSYVYYNLAAADYPHAVRFAARVHEADLLALRNGSLRLIPIINAQGLISFPSFHAAIGVLLIYAACYLRYLFPLLLLANSLMIVSVFKDGGHYLVDALSGIAIALAAIGVAWRVSRAY